MEEERKVKARLQWVQLYQKTGNASLVCRRWVSPIPPFASGGNATKHKEWLVCTIAAAGQNAVRHPRCSSNTASGFCNCASANWELGESRVS